MRGLLMRIWDTIAHRAPRATPHVSPTNGRIRSTQREIDELTARLRAYEERIQIEDEIDRTEREGDDRWRWPGTPSR